MCLIQWHQSNELPVSNGCTNPNPAKFHQTPWSTLHLFPKFHCNFFGYPVLQHSKHGSEHYPFHQVAEVTKASVVVTYSDTGEVREGPHLHRAVSRRRGKALVNWRELDTPDATSMARTHANQRQICRIPHLPTTAHIFLPIADNMGDRAVPVAASKAWNSLPLSGRYAMTLVKFLSRTRDVFVPVEFRLTLPPALNHWHTKLSTSAGTFLLTMYSDPATL